MSVLSRLFLLSFILLSAFSFSLLFSGQLPHLIVFMDLLIILIFPFVVRTTPTAITYASCFILYVFYFICYVLLFFGSKFMIDAVVAFKFLVYLSLFFMVVRSEKLAVSELKVIFLTLMWLFLLKYLVGRLLGYERPALYTENNFELCFLLIIYVTCYYFRLVGTKSFLLIGFIIILSGSRSAILSFFIVYLYQFKPWKSAKISSLLFKVIIFISVVSIVGMALFMRMSSKGIEGVDRYVFMMVFFQNIIEWGVWEYLVGNPPLTPLLSSSCAQLSFYQALFSKADPSICFPVILHSFWLRLILEHGLLLVGFLSFSFIALFSIKGYRKSFAVTLFAMIALNGVSVSALNSSMISLAIFIILLIKIPYSYKINVVRN
jgi:hypothetical protein